MILRRFTLAVLTLITLSIYFFVSAPAPLPDDTAVNAQIPVEKMFEILNDENKAVRSIWSKEIVGKGKEVGLKFEEHWKVPSTEAGPLPALFLRETAKVLELDPTPLSLFLGSDFPIASSNKFDGHQKKSLQSIRHTGKPEFFYNEDLKTHSAMFADVAVAQACVDCHNKHPDSPKTDWKLNDIMGATTWSYPKSKVTSDEIMQNVAALRRGFKTAYMDYLRKVESFKNKPEIGEKWPTDGFYLPSLEVFMKKIDQEVSGNTLDGILTLISKSEKDNSKKKGASL
jgi:adenylate cyclase